jgi:CelD/BcsL family acetyltransferase involved in cellulose biosynthesis
MHDAVSCEILRTTHEIERFQPDWTSLWNADPHATPFQRPEWLVPWWHQFGQQELQAIVLSQHERQIAFLPFYIYRESNSSERQLLLLGAGTTDYLDGIFAPECRPEHVRTALELVQKESGWDVLYASQLRSKSMLFQALQQASDAGVQSFRGETCSRMRAVRMPELPVKIRRNTMNYRNRAARLGRLEFVVADQSNWSSSFDALVSTHTARWKSCGEPGPLWDQRIVAWHREALPQLEANGMLRLCLLRLNNEILSVLYSLIDPAGRPDRTQYFYITAYSSEHGKLGPGTLLFALAIERAAEEGVETIDLLRGVENYKNLWHVEHVPTYGFALRSAMRENGAIT